MTPSGTKLVQQVEYEWMPLYCKKCNKAGHECKKKEPIKKAWVPKQDLKPIAEDPKLMDQMEPIVVTDHGKQKVVEEDHNPWTKVTPAFKPYRALRFDDNGNLDCTNGFDILGVGECSIVSKTVT